MAEGKLEYDWSLVSNVMALIANCHRSESQQPFKAEDFNPMIPVAKRVVNKEQLSSLFAKYGFK